MIVSSMTLDEVAAALHKDVVELQRHVAARYWEAERRHRKTGKGVMQQVGEYTSTALIQWTYVVCISTTKTTLYPMAWYFTQQGIHAFQIEAEGPSTYLRPHVLDRYRQRFFPHADVLEALREMHKRNYDKASQPREYKGKPAIASAVEDGYLLGELVNKGTIVNFHTFYDVKMGAKEAILRDMRQMLEIRRYLAATNPRIHDNRSTNYVNWGQGFPLRLEKLHKAA